jgi:hypothetical protein
MQTKLLFLLKACALRISEGWSYDYFHDHLNHWHCDCDNRKGEGGLRRGWRKDSICFDCCDWNHMQVIDADFLTRAQNSRKPPILQIPADYAAILETQTPRNAPLGWRLITSSLWRSSDTMASAKFTEGRGELYAKFSSDSALHAMLASASKRNFSIVARLWRRCGLWPFRRIALANDAKIPKLFARQHEKLNSTLKKGHETPRFMAFGDARCASALSLCTPKWTGARTRL